MRNLRRLRSYKALTDAHFTAIMEQLIGKLESDGKKIRNNHIREHVFIPFAGKKLGYKEYSSIDSPK